MITVTLLGTPAPLKTRHRGNDITPMGIITMIIGPVLCFLMLAVSIEISSFTLLVGSTLFGIIKSINIYPALFFIYILFAMVSAHSVGVNHTNTGINNCCNLPAYIGVGIFVSTLILYCLF